MSENGSSRKTEGLWSIVLVELTNLCNFSCEFCPSDSMDRPKTMMPRELWRKVLIELGEKKMTRTVFFHLMGEPLLHKDVFEAIRFANAKGLSVSFYTNGALLDEEVSEKLLGSLQKGRVVLSMQDITPDEFSRRSHGALSWKGYLDRLKRFVVKAESRGKNVQVHCLADLRHNLPDIISEADRIQKVYDRWHELLNGENKQRINIFDPAREYPLGKTTTFFVKHKGNWDNKLIGSEMVVRPSERGSCDLVTDTFAVLADGTCTYCCCDYEGELDLGNAMDDSLEDIYYGEKATRIRQKAKEGRFIEDRCKICRGTVVYKKTGKPVPTRSLVSEYYFFLDHFKRYGFLSSLRKIMDNIRRRLGK
ncbi:MAG: radical SAM protein [Candidatus Omnitrophica bacterium]|nr:radical SAM protein [Candidatus Omnitrophota bacterium]